jgi:hypothetical protein
MRKWSYILFLFIIILVIVTVYTLFYFNKYSLNFLFIPLAFLGYPIFLLIMKVYNCSGDGCWALLYHPISLILFILWFTILGFLIGSIIGFITRLIKKNKFYNFD